MPKLRITCFGMPRIVVVIGAIVREVKKGIAELCVRSSSSSIVIWIVFMTCLFEELGIHTTPRHDAFIAGFHCGRMQYAPTRWDSLISMSRIEALQRYSAWGCSAYTLIASQ